MSENNIMSKLSLGDKLYNILLLAQGQMFKLGQMLQLSYNAFEFIAKHYGKYQEEKIKLEYPLGLYESGEPIRGEYTYDKKKLIEHYADLAELQLPLNGIYRLVSITETMLGDTIREILLKYPKKIGNRKIPVFKIFECSSLEAVHLSAILEFVNELSYKTISEYAESASKIFGFNLLEILPFHRFIEIKATRDIYIHNNGIANDIYKRKAGLHARAEPDNVLPISNKYFLESYEHCLKLVEILTDKFHSEWPSQEYEKFKQKNPS